VQLKVGLRRREDGQTTVALAPKGRGKREGRLKPRSPWRPGECASCPPPRSCPSSCCRAAMKPSCDPLKLQSVVQRLNRQRAPSSLPACGRLVRRKL